MRADLLLGNPAEAQECGVDSPGFLGSPDAFFLVQIESYVWKSFGPMEPAGVLCFRLFGQLAPVSHNAPRLNDQYVTPL
jgi:hypothetical protein